MEVDLHRSYFAIVFGLFSCFLWASAVITAHWTGHIYILPYAIALGLLLLTLSRVRGYREHRSRRTFDLIFLGYLWAIVWVRCRSFRWSLTLEKMVNIGEHIGFALVIGLMAYLIFLLVFGLSSRRAMFAGFFSFNLLGIGNEIFQDLMGGEGIAFFDADAWKDIGVNAAGSLLLVVLLWWRDRSLLTEADARTRAPAPSLH